MPRFENPTVLVTRPQDSSERFARALEHVAGPFETVICPAFEYEGTTAHLPDFDIAVFTSRAGVLFAPKGAGRKAYCVGDATASVATQSGYSSISADGAARDLVDLILDQRPQGRLLHIRGETSVGDVMDHLAAGGLSVAECVVYRKQVAGRGSLRKALEGSGGTVIIPLFSAETVSILATGNLNFSAAHVVAISQTVAEGAVLLSPGSISIAKAPTQAEMIAAAARLIA